eukprot:GEMP01004383.1.p1 GENE.GEMP01004383.1~~GEMP01004383.1.p1  ORF type:complete len:736 (+),score=174.24 GEMP01004383.1:153-2360(+)
MALVDINLSPRLPKENKLAIYSMTGQKNVCFGDRRRPMTTGDPRKRVLSSSNEDRGRIRLKNGTSIESGRSLASQKITRCDDSRLVEFGNEDKGEVAENGSRVTMRSQGQQVKIDDFDRWSRIVLTQILQDDAKGMFGSTRLGERPRSHKGLLTDLRKAMAGVSVDRQIEETLDFAEVVLGRVSKVNAALATIPPVQEKRPDLYSIYFAEMAENLVRELGSWVRYLPNCISLYHVQLLENIEETKELRSRCATMDGKFKELTAERDLTRRKLNYFLDKSKFDQADTRAELLGIPTADRAKLDAEYEQLFGRKADPRLGGRRSDRFSNLVALNESRPVLHSEKSIPFYPAPKSGEVVPPEQQLKELKVLVDNMAKAVHSAEEKWSMTPIREELREVLMAVGLPLTRPDPPPDRGHLEATDERTEEPNIQSQASVDAQLGFDRRTIQRLVQESLGALKEIQTSLGESHESAYINEVREFLHAVAFAQRRFDLPVGITRPDLPQKKISPTRHMPYDPADSYASSGGDSQRPSDKKKLEEIQSRQVVVGDARQLQDDSAQKHHTSAAEPGEGRKARDSVAPSKSTPSDIVFPPDGKSADACIAQPMYPEGHPAPEGHDALWSNGEIPHPHSQSLDSDPRGGRPFAFEFDGPGRRELRPATQGSPATDGGTEMRSGAAFTPERITAQAKAFGPLNLYRAICSVDDVRLRNAILGALEPYRYHCTQFAGRAAIDCLPLLPP